MTPEEIHQLGLSEVARITKEFEKVQAQMGFKGTLQQFFDYMRTSPKFQPKSQGGARARLRQRQGQGRGEGPAISSRWCRRPGS